MVTSYGASWHPCSYSCFCFVSILQTTRRACDSRSLGDVCIEFVRRCRLLLHVCGLRYRFVLPSCLRSKPLRFVAFGARSVLVSESVCESESATCLLQRGEKGESESEREGVREGKVRKGGGRARAWSILCL